MTEFNRKLLQSVTGIKMCDRCYKVGQETITKCDRYYKV